MAIKTELFLIIPEVIKCIDHCYQKHTGVIPAQCVLSEKKIKRHFNGLLLRRTQ